MSRALITESYLTGIANAIRAKLGVQDTYTPPQMAAAIESIPTGGITPTGTKQITQNGTHDVTQYASANVNVQPTLQSKTVTQNGTVTPDQGYDGLSSVVVNVQGGGGEDSIDLIKGLNGTNYARLSNNASDRVERDTRYFQRSTNEPIIFLPTQTADKSYTGYGCIAFTDAGIGGTYSENGNLALLSTGTTTKGTVFYLYKIQGQFQPSQGNNITTITIDGIANEIIISNAEAYINTGSQSLDGSASALAEVESWIDRIYEVYYA